jgi:hypothetical protein
MPTLRRPFASRFLIAALLAVGAAPLFAADPIVVPRADFPNAKPQMGVNLEGVVDYARSMMFADAMKSARKFGSVDAPWDESAPKDAKGWPTADCGVVVMADAPVKAGDYLFSCTGRCTLGLVNTRGTVKGQGYNREKNITTATVSISEGATNLFLSFKNTEGGIKNIKLMRPGFPLNTPETFSKEFLSLIAPFSTLRTMDLTLTNNSDVVDWSERTTLDHALQSSPKGVAWEYAIELANKTKKDLWINVPDRANDDYVRQLAKLFKEKLDPSLTVYVEFSNEVWNSMFKQGGRNHEAAKAEIAAGDKTLNDNGKDDNQYYWGWKRVSKRTLEISKIFAEVFGQEAINTRIRPILASQSANSFMTRMQVEYIEKHHGPPAKFIYGIAGAPYLSPDQKVSDKENATVEEIIKAFNVEAWCKKVMVEYLVMARYYRLHHLCYEGGLGIEGDKSLDAKMAANRDPRIAKVINDYFNAWYGTGGELFMYYNLAGMWTKHGCWGLTDNVAVQTPKYKAVAALATAAMPPLNVGHAVPGVVQAWQFDANVGGGVETSNDGGKNLAFIGNGHRFDYLLNVKEPGEYLLTIQAAGWDDAARVALDMSGTPLGEVKITKTGDGQKWANSAPVRLKLEKGQLVLRMNVVKAAMNVRSITLEKSAITGARN